MMFMEVLFIKKLIFKIFLGTGRYFRTISVEKHKMQISFADFTNLDKLKAEIKPNTKVTINYYFVFIIKYKKFLDDMV